MADDLNKMHFLRRWAQHNKALVPDIDGSVTLTAEAAKIIADGVWVLFSMTDAAWELCERRKLTGEEKFGREEDAIRCPECGQPVPDFFDHVADDCTGVAYNDSVYRLREVAKTLENARGQAFAIDYAQLAYDIRNLIKDPK